MEKQQLLLPKDFVPALTIAERNGILEEKHTSEDLPNIKKWRSKTSILDEKKFKKRLDVCGLSSQRFEQLIDINNYSDKSLVQYVVQSEWFEWTIKIADALEDEKYDKEYNLYYYIKPFVRIFTKEVRNSLDSYNLIDTVYVDLEHALLVKLMGIAQKTLMLELNFARENNFLLGDTGEDRFHYFCQQGLDAQMLAKFYIKYPVLARLLIETTMNALNNAAVLFERFEKHKCEIYQLLGIEQAVGLVSAKIDMGDSHEKGNAVVKLGFSNGKVLLYKPRDIRIVNEYNHIIDWFNQANDLLEMKKTAGLYYESYAFEAFIEYNSCLNETEVKHYYQRFGQLLAMMHIMNGNDLHMENIIANGEYPVIIDLETLVQQRLPLNIDDAGLDKPSEILANSVGATILLPDKTSDLKVDLSALAGDEQVLGIKTDTVINEQSDTMRIGQTEGVMLGSNNIPKIKEKTIDYKNYLNEIVLGFEKVYCHVLNHKEAFTNEVNGFRDVKVRFIVRNTNNYARMLNMCLHPLYMKDFIDREMILENIWSHILENESVGACEYNDMLFNDVPIFYTYTNSKSLINSENYKIENFFPQTSFDCMLEKINSLSFKNLGFQKSFIKVKTGQFNPHHLSHTFQENLIGSDSYSQHTTESLIKEATYIGDYIRKQAFISDDKSQVLFLSIDDSKEDLNVAVTNQSFYNGMSGLALFYYYLYQSTGSTEYKEMFDQIINTLEENTTIDKKNPNTFTGSASELTTLTLLKSKDILKYQERIDALILSLNNHINSIENSDWLGGLSSIIQSLSNYYNVTQKENIKKMILDYGKRLITIVEDEDLIGGFSHGSSGVYQALLEAYRVTNNLEFYEKAKIILAHDRTFFDSSKGWSDERHENKVYPTHWCHGSVGIALSRIENENIFFDYQMSEEINFALETVNNSFYTQDDTLCHGNLGKSELFLASGNREKAMAIASKVIENKKEKGKYHDNSLPEIDNYSLFTGLTGIGYQILRIAKPDLVPSVLSLKQVS
ncbi:MAG: type 2 lanthipeptide synthetase LanM family protein [Turicibacter sp.]|nr:type 2 lanthipeptide synthetase LanM family protein [Turicibacter sp.]